MVSRCACVLFSPHDSDMSQTKTRHNKCTNYTKTSKRALTKNHTHTVNYNCRNSTTQETTGSDTSSQMCPFGVASPLKISRSFFCGSATRLLASECVGLSPRVNPTLHQRSPGQRNVARHGHLTQVFVQDQILQLRPEHDVRNRRQERVPQLANGCVLERWMSKLRRQVSYTVSLSLVTMTSMCASKECAHKTKLYGSAIAVAICG